MIVLSVSRPNDPAPTPGVVVFGDGIFRRKRQNTLSSSSGSGFVSQNGTTDSCAAAAKFEIIARQLINLETQQPLSVNPGVPYISLSDPGIGSVSTEIGVANGLLVWRNSVFPNNGSAGFCEANDFVYVIFTSSPPDCVPVSLVAEAGS